MLGRKKKKPEWLPVDAPPPAPSKEWIPVREDQPGPNWLATSAPPPRPSDPDPNARPAPRSDPSVWAPTPPPPAPKTAPPKPAKDRELWADPILSPWAPPATVTEPAQPVAAPVGMDAVGKTTCPRCSTPISYPRRGSPPWDVLCPTCGAKGRISK